MKKIIGKVVMFLIGILSQADKKEVVDMLVETHYPGYHLHGNPTKKKAVV